MDNRCKEAKIRVDAIFQELEELGFDVYRPLSINDIELPSHLGYDYGVCRLVVWDCTSARQLSQTSPPSSLNRSTMALLISWEVWVGM